jgi:hypothetical protein
MASSPKARVRTRFGKPLKGTSVLSTERPDAVGLAFRRLAPTEEEVGP